LRFFNAAVEFTDFGGGELSRTFLLRLLQFSERTAEALQQLLPLFCRRCLGRVFDTESHKLSQQQGMVTSGDEHGG
jgi:hypothetical protein